MSVCWAPIQSVLLYKSVMDTADWDTSYISIVIQVTATTQSRHRAFHLQLHIDITQKWKYMVLGCLGYMLQ